MRYLFIALLLVGCSSKIDENALAKAERDFPAKKADLEQRRHGDPKDLNAKVNQLYESWDKVLEDLEESGSTYREKIKTVRNRQGHISDSTGWVDVSAPQYRSVEKDIGMAIAHKDIGQYDSEASNVPQPAGYAYIAPPGQRNQYGYWSQNEHGSFWTFLPEYLIMQHLFWGHSYQPVYINEYNGYSTALRRGTSYYGQETPAAPPKFGTHGTFTQQNYSGSRYVAGRNFHPSVPPSDPAGHRFGTGSSRPPSGQRFGSGGGSSSGRRFGGRRR